ncbi:AAA family ATPase [Segetibacter koreensis]|uniref:AAA family ATPase n=1 Tax=Segetibacter koreensis TaxID=398037 RepID=UPI00035F0007|nr:AAA family ATPase [Segetibacter koreensis]
MFKLLKVQFDNHPVLRDLKLDFVNYEEVENKQFPYTTVMIGPNGTGKSHILKAIADTFVYFKDFQLDESLFWTNSFGFSIEFKFYKDTYEIRTGRFKIFNKKGEHRKVECLKNKPKNFESLSPEEKDFFVVLSREVELPMRVLVSSVMLTDRFTFRDSTPDDFYQYLGVRRNRSTSSTQTFERKTIRYLFDATKTNEFKINLAEILDFMGLEEQLTVSYSIKYKDLFEKQTAKLENFHQFFTEWWIATNGKRKRENKPWGLWYYEKIKEDEEKILRLLKLLNDISDGLVLKQDSKRSREFIIDVFKEEQIFESYSLIEELIFLDLLRLEGIRIKKKDTKAYGVENSSSGEYHLLISLLGIFSRIQPDSLIFIDEPEISLHPNWQMRYIHELKRMFYKYSTCHFILASHSHFIVSDLENTSSSVLALRNNENAGQISANLLTAQTYGWSAEEVLYSIFDVKTTRNKYLEEDLRFLLHNIAIKSTEYAEMQRIVEKLKSLKFSASDPITLIIAKAEEYLTND